MPEKQKELVLTSFKDLQSNGPEFQLDLEEDAWSYGAPPPPGVYVFKWFLDKDGIVIKNEKEDDPNSPQFARISLVGRLDENEDWKDSVCYANLDSRIFRGKGISTLAGFLLKAGAKKYLEGKKPNLKELGNLFDAVIKREPIIPAEIDWRGSYQWTNNKGESLWENACKHWVDFPEDKDNPGQRLHAFSLTGKDGLSHDIRAQVQVVRFMTRVEAKEWKPKTNLVSQPRTGGNAPLAQKVVVPELVAPQVVQASKVVPAVVQTGATVDDLSYILDEEG